MLGFLFYWFYSDLSEHVSASRPLLQSFLIANLDLLLDFFRNDFYYRTILASQNFKSELDGCKLVDRSKQSSHYVFTEITGLDATWFFLWVSLSKKSKVINTVSRRTLE